MTKDEKPTAGGVTPECKHGHVGYCGFCEAEKAPKCKKHGRPWYCCECGPVGEGARLQEQGR